MAPFLFSGTGLNQAWKAQPDRKMGRAPDGLPRAIWALMAFDGLKLWLENKTK